MDKKLQELILQAEKPARYTGGEPNQPTMTGQGVRVCMCMPDLYEVGMSNLGLKILYHRINDLPNAECERCFAPADDFGKILKQNNYPLFSLETSTPLKDFDLVGFSVQFELLYSNVLYMLDLAGIPFRAVDRDSSYPILMAGGPCSVNPEPFADFFDMINIGEGEDMMKEIVDLYEVHKKKGFDKKAFLEDVQSIQGVYVPSLNTPENRKIVHKAFVPDFDKCYCPTKQIVPTIEAVHDRTMVELYRGCANGCRFCQAGFWYRPIRYRKVETVKKLCEDTIKQTGFEELSLASLSTGDYPGIYELIPALKPCSEKYHVNFALPSLRLDTFKGEFSQESRKSSLTFAPEAGTQRLRDVINKNVTDEDIMRSIEYAFSSGYQSIKLYFMLGLPTETQEDLDGIVTICKKIKYKYREMHGGKGAPNISVSCAVFVPKPFTPFQWAEQITPEQMIEKQRYLLGELKKVKCVDFKYHDNTTSQVEGVFARGDRRLSKVIERAYAMGAKMDGWTEFFKYDVWMKALADEGLEPKDYTREWSLDEELPWSFIDSGVTEKFFKHEKELADKGIATESCNKGCKGCGCKKLCDCNEWSDK